MNNLKTIYNNYLFPIKKIPFEEAWNKTLIEMERCQNNGEKFESLGKKLDLLTKYAK